MLIRLSRHEVEALSKGLDLLSDPDWWKYRPLNTRLKMILEKWEEYEEMETWWDNTNQQPPSEDERPVLSRRTDEEVNE